MTLALESLSCFPELVEVAAAAADSCCYVCGIVGTEYFLSDGASVDERTAGSLITQTNYLSVSRTDVDGVLSDICFLDLSVYVDAEILVRHSEILSVALSILQNESSLCAVDIGSVLAAALESLVKSRLILLVGGGDNSLLELILLAELGIGLAELVPHSGNFLGERVHIDSDLVTRRAAAALFLLLGLVFAAVGAGAAAVVGTAGCEARCHRYCEDCR